MYFPFLWGFCAGHCAGHCFGMHYSMSFLVLQSLDEDERAGCIAFLSVRCLDSANALLLFLSALLVCFHFIVEIYPDHTHFLIQYCI